MIKAVLFDWDGTILDNYEVIMASYRDATTEVLGRSVPSTPEEESRLIRLRGQESFGSMSDDPDVVAQIAAAYHRAYLVNVEKAGVPFPGAREVLESLRDRGLQVGVVTSKARVRYESDAARFGLADLFAVAVTGDEAIEAKPHPGPVLLAMDQLGLPSEEVVFAGDGPQDVAAGNAAGATSVGCRYGFHADEIDEAGADHVIDALSDIVALVDSLQSGRA